jgi:hypothetical protein
MHDEEEHTTQHMKRQACFSFPAEQVRHRHAAGAAGAAAAAGSDLAMLPHSSQGHSLVTTRVHHRLQTIPWLVASMISLKTFWCILLLQLHSYILACRAGSERMNIKQGHPSHGISKGA